MYKRKIENVLQSWLDDAFHKPLVVKGVRQCGKTSSVMDFEEWLWANGMKVIHFDYLKKCLNSETPVECKATTGNAKSMRTVVSHPEKYHVTSAIKLGDYNIGRKDQLLTLPMYMAFLLKEV